MEDGAPLRVPLGVGEIVSDALSALRAHFGAFLVVALPFSALDLLCREAAGSSLDAARAALGTDPSQVDFEQIGAALWAAARGIALYGGSFAATQLLGAVVVVLAAGAWAGAVPARGAALRAGMGRALALIGTSSLFTLILIAVEVPALAAAAVLVAVDVPVATWVGGALVALYALAAFVFVTLRYGLFTQTVVLERRHTLGAFGRSADLLAARGERVLTGPKMRLSVVFLAALALGAALQGLFAIPRFLMAGAIGWSVGDAGLPPLTALPLWFGVPFALVEVATNAVVLPFSGILLTLFYFDLRVRYEAIDAAPRSTP